METIQPKPRRRRFSKTLIVITILIELVFSGFLCLLMVKYGPFENIRVNLITMAMKTYRHQYIARLFFTQKEIDAVLSSGSTVQAASQDITKVKPKYYDNQNITLEKIDSTDSSYTGYLLQISDPLRVKLAMTKYLGKVGQQTSAMAEENSAVAAINAGGFSDNNWAGTGAKPSDFVIQDGKLVWQDPSYNGRDKRFCIGFNTQGTLVVGNMSLESLQSMSVQVENAVTLNGYPTLVVNGKGTYKSARQAVKDSSFQPRTAIGQKADGTVLMLVLDGRQLSKSGTLMKGASLYDVQKIMLDNGAVTAVNLDGGNSTTMYYDGEVINSPSGEFGERTVATSFYVK